MYNKNYFRFALGMAMLASTDPFAKTTNYIDEETMFPEVSEDKKKDLMHKAGLKQFMIQGQEIWAINEKNAYRKFKKLNP